MPSGRRSEAESVNIPPRVFIDTSKLFPFTIMDVLLSLSEDLLFTWVWTEDVLEEWQTVIVREDVRSPESAQSVADAVRTFFASSRIDPVLYQDRATADLSPDPGDRLHAAACIHGDVDTLLTRNLKHFRTQAIAEAGVEVTTSDAFLCTLLSHYPGPVSESFSRTAAAKKNPVVSPSELADRIAKAGAPLFAERVRPHLES